MIVFTQLASAIFCVVYGSFFEWFWHKHWMHHPRTPKIAFEGHTLTHHVLYKGDQSYFVDDDHEPHHILLKPYSLPLILLIHLPILYLIDRFVIHHTLIGGGVAMVSYFLIYEYMHWNMHVPRKQWVERYRWFQFLRRHHHLHHRYMQYNFCVLVPLADWVLGSMITDASLAKRKQEREQAIAAGAPLPDRKPRNRRNEPSSSVPDRYEKSQGRRVRVPSERKLPDVLELIQNAASKRK